MADDRTIPQRELRNNISEVLRSVEAGDSFTVTVRGRPVARVVPTGHAGEPRVEVARSDLRRILAEPIDGDLGRELAAAEEPVGDPWPLR